MNTGILILFLLTAAAALLIIFRKKKSPEMTLLSSVMKTAVNNGGTISSKSLKDPAVRELVNKMYPDGIAVPEPAGKGEVIWSFMELPRKHMPVAVRDTDEFYGIIERLGEELEDGQVFFSRIAAEVDMEYEDLIVLLGEFGNKEGVRKEISPSGNAYFMFDEDYFE